jgi:fatty acid desaturase
VPLSDHEQRLLEQIERALYAEDPKFATSVRATDLRTHYRRRLIRSAIGFVVGLAILVAGVVTQAFYLVVGVIGFLVMLGFALLGVSAWKRLTAGSRPGRPATGTRGAATPRPSVMERFEERWRRRRDENF